MISNNFDRVAFIYDALARIVFGSNLRKAQSHFLNRIPEKSKILVLGSGTGWIADEILAIIPDAQITLVDASQKMTAKAKSQFKGRPVTILCSDETHQFYEPFDVIILPFFLDMFPTEKLSVILSQIKRNVHEDTLWLVTDFVSVKWWHKAYLWAMYGFFKITCALETATLPGWEESLNRHFKLRNEEKFYGDFIVTKLLAR